VTGRDAEADFFGLPGGTLVELVGLGVGWGLRLVEPVQVRFVVGDPFANGASAALVAGGAKVATFAGEGEEAFVAAVCALETDEADGEVAATEERLDGGDCVGAEWAENLAVLLLVVCEEVVPAVVDELPEWQGTRSAGLERVAEDCGVDLFSCG
jgi:hypothetical protein